MPTIAAENGVRASAPRLANCVRLLPRQLPRPPFFSLAAGEAAAAFFPGLPYCESRSISASSSSWRAATFSMSFGAALSRKVAKSSMLIESRSNFARWASSPARPSAVARSFATGPVSGRQERRNLYPPRARKPENFLASEANFHRCSADHNPAPLSPKSRPNRSRQSSRDPTHLSRQVRKGNKHDGTGTAARGGTRRDRGPGGEL